MRVLLSCSFLLALGLQAESPEAAMAKIAAKSGLAQWETVEQIEYTFHVELPNKSVERSWQWRPKADAVVYSEGGEIIASYTRGEGADPKVDQKFINDLYWLAFPFVVAWDSSVRLERLEADAFTAGIEAAGAIRVVYPDGVGYTPGDVYEVYYDADCMMSHWVFRKGGNAVPNLVCTREEFEAFGPLVLATEHRSYPLGPFHLWFTNVKVTTATP